MPSERPRYIMRNATIFLNGDSLLGQASEIGFPSLKRKMEKVFNAGQETEIEVPVGHEMPEISFKMTGLHPSVLKLYGLKIGAETEYMATAAEVDDDGEEHSVVCYFRGIMTEVKPDSHKRGDMTEADYTLSFRYYKLEIDGQPIIELDAFRVVIAGEDQTAGIRRALLIG